MSPPEVIDEPDHAPPSPLTPLGAALLPDYAVELAWHPDMESIAAACADGGVWRVDPITGESIEVARHDGGATRVAYTTDGLLASWGQDGRVVLGTGVSFAPSSDGGLAQLAWRPDGEVLAVAAGRHVGLWSRDGEQLAESEELPATVESVEFHPAGAHLAAGGAGGVTVLGGAEAETIQRLDWTGKVLAMAFNPDGLSLAYGTQEASVCLWDMLSTEATATSSFDRKVRALAWRVDGAWLAAAGGQAISVSMFEDGVAAGATARMDLTGHERAVSWVGFRTHSSLLASTAADGYLLLWNLPDTTAPWAVATLAEPIACGAWSPDGSAIAIGGAGGTVAVFAING